jgi:phospholipase C
MRYAVWMMTRLGLQLGTQRVRAVVLTGWPERRVRAVEVPFDPEQPDEAVDALRALVGTPKRIAVEGGGYYDSGYIQPLDVFGDGTRVPMLVVSPFSKGVGVVHEYTDHVSFAKFVEANWGLQSISPESRDNLPNPIVSPNNPYVPLNSPALGDMMSFFKFPNK